MLREAGTVAITTLDADRQPLAGAEVLIVGPGQADEGGETHTVRTDAKGHAELGALAPGAYSAALGRRPAPMRIGAASIVMMSGPSGYAESRVSFSVEAGRTASATLVQPVLTTLRGTLRDARGPVAGGQVRVERAAAAGSGVTEEIISAPLPMGGPSAETDADGRFSIPDLTAGDYVVRYGRADQVVLQQEPLVLAGERVAERALVLTGGALVVAVRDADGQPLPRAQVALEPAGSSAAPVHQQRVMVMMTVGADGEGEQSMELGTGTPAVRTDEDGVARIADIPAGSYDVSISHPRHQRRVVPDVAIATDTERDLGSVQLTAAGVIRGTLRAGEGVSAPMIASVELRRADGTGDPKTTTAVRGGFRFDGLSPGFYTLRARGMGPAQASPWGPPQDVEVRPGETAQIELSL
jgi:hypothetical protein